MRIVFFGTPEFAVPTLEAIVNGGHEILLVVSRPDQPAGRNLQMTSPAVVGTARALSLPLAQPEKVGNEEFVGRLRALRPEAAVVVAYGKLIPARLLRVPQHGFVNLHPSLLPRHRGPAPIEGALLAGDAETGVTAMLLDEGMDTGPILLQKRTPIGARERAPELDMRLRTLGAELIVETLAALARGAVKPVPQDPALASVTPKLDRKSGRIEWARPADELARRSRAFDPWPGLYATFRGNRIKVHGFEVEPERSGDQEPGTVLGVSGAGIAVRCGGGTVGLITELQREGKRRLPADAFIIGERVAAGEHFR